MRPPIYRPLMEQVNRNWLANKLSMTPQHEGIDLISPERAVELKSRSTFWNKNTWAYNANQIKKHEGETQGLQRWLAAMEYIAIKRPEEIRTFADIEANVASRKIWLVPWEHLETLPTSVNTKNPWKYPNKTTFTQTYDFKCVRRYKDGTMYAPRDHVFEF